MPRFAPLFVVASLGLLVACSGSRPQPDGATAEGPSRTALRVAYDAAVADASIAEPSEIVTTLTPVVPHNDALTWRTVVTAAGDSTRQVRVVHWTGGFADVAPGDSVTVRADGPLWVTMAPEVRRFCRSLDRTGEPLAMRLRQRLGLPPDAPYVRFVEAWVDPDALARPCPDPAITDRECGTTPPGPPSVVTVDAAYQAWFDTLQATSYGPDGYPWTRLGYTYDWARPDGDEVGPSEFIVRPGRTVVVASTDSTDAYCQSGGS